ncbi:MAG: hypothetical protein L3K26_04810 [Candidatus Hydrogenedentes bacterium]|nr:hypothetical protein [Candidatus Hydrogenedentota bacterium]
MRSVRSIPAILFLLSAMASVAETPAPVQEPAAPVAAAPVPALPAPAPNLLEPALAGPLADVEEIVFSLRKPGKDGHWYANFSYYAEGPSRVTYESGGKLLKYNLRSGETTVLLDDPAGGIRDPQVHYDGEKIIFAWRKGDDTHFHLYEIGVDGSGLRQLTDGDYDDLEPTYLPDGGIMFVSSRCKRWVNCWLTQVAVLHRCDGDGTNIRQVSSNNEHDNTPWLLPDGRVLYQRWEYVDRSQVHYHHLWTMNPDGSGQMTYYGNMEPGILMIDAKPIPGTDKILSIFSPGHGRREHAGRPTIVDPKAGPDALQSAWPIHEGTDFRDPYPLSEDRFLMARKDQILLMNRAGETEQIFRVSEEDREAGLECHEPRPIQKRARELILPPRSNPEEETGTLILANVYEGRNMGGVEPGEVKKLLVLESLPKPINYTGGMEPLSYGGTFTLERVLGTVPVEPDGSAYMEVPALRSLILVALDKNDLSIKRMQSFLTVQPGEALSCVGCHEQRTRTTLPATKLQAMSREPSAITSITDVPDVFDFPRDIQPILDRNCVDCHDYTAGEKGGPRAGNVILTGDRGPLYSHSYFTLSALRQFSDGRNLPKSNYAPRTFGSAASALLKMLDGEQHDVQTMAHEKKVIRLWIETGAPYPGTYAARGSGMVGGYAENKIDRSDTEWPTMQAAQQVLQNRCDTCHAETAMKLPDSPSDNMDMPPWAIKYDDPRLRFSRHILYNLSRPEMSLQVLAPLAQESGGLGICRDESGAAVFKDMSDGDYQTLLTAVKETKQYLDTIKRFDMPGFQPKPPYMREMRRYGILPSDYPDDGEIDPYETDRAYWESLWWKPVKSVAPLAKR